MGGQELLDIRVEGELLQDQAHGDTRPTSLGSKKPAAGRCCLSVPDLVLLTAILPVLWRDPKWRNMSATAQRRHAIKAHNHRMRARAIKQQRDTNQSG